MWIGGRSRAVVGGIVGATSSETLVHLPPHYHQHLLNLCLLHFHIGWRALYFAIPVAVANAGAIPFICATVAIALWLVWFEASAMA